MNREAFMLAVEEFVQQVCGEYTRESSWAMVGGDELRAEIRLETHDGEKWRVPVTVYNGQAAIDIGDAGHLSLEPEGYYAYLWMEACARLREANKAAHRWDNMPCGKYGRCTAD